MSYTFEVIKTKSEVLEECEQSIQLFLKDFGSDDIFHDAEFEPSHGTMEWDKHGTIRYYRDIKNRNCTSIYYNPYPFNAQQGKLGDCWLIAPLMTIARRRSLLEQILPDNDYSIKYGIFPVRLFYNEKWEVVVVDGNFPIQEDGTMLVARLIYRELWPCLIEKAVAKLSGGYQKLRGGCGEQAFRYLTGASCETYFVFEDEDFEILWEKLMEVHSSDFLLSCSLCGVKPPESYRQKGLHSNHVYPILNLSVRDGHRLLHIGCTNRKRWNGKWSELPPYDENTIKSFREWEKIESSRKTFWIEIDDFRTWFRCLTVCRYREGWDEIRMNGHRQEGELGVDRILRIHVKKLSEITVEVTLNLPSHENISHEKSEFDNDIGLICVHHTSSNGELGDLVTTFPVQVCNTKEMEKVTRNIETDPFYLEPGSYSVMFVHVSEKFSKVFNWIIWSPTIIHITHDFAACQFNKISHFSLQSLMLKYGKPDQQIEEGIVIWKYNNDTFAMFMYDNETSKPVQILMTVWTTIKYRPYQLMSPRTHWNKVSAFESKSNGPLLIAPNSRCILGTVWFPPYDFKFIQQQPLVCEYTVEVVDCEEHDEFEQDSSHNIGLYEPIPV